jgi:hypothetical protein
MWLFVSPAAGGGTKSVPAVLYPWQHDGAPSSVPGVMAARRRRHYYPRHPQPGYRTWAVWLFRLTVAGFVVMMAARLLGLA